MTIIQLEYLLAVANCGSFSAAAKKCFVTQPSLSMQIKSLEQELGAVLLDRTKKPVIPTHVGEAVLLQARETLSAFNTIKEIATATRGSISGRLRVGILPTIAPYILNLLLPLLDERCPDVEVEIVEMTAAKIIESLDRDAIDVAIMSAGTTPENINTIELFNDRLMVYLSPRSPLSARTSIRLDEINSKNLLVLSAEHCFRYQVLELLSSPYDDEPAQFNSNYTASSLETLMSFVDSSDMMTVLPEMAVRMLPLERKYQVRPLAKGAISRKVVLATRRGYIKQSVIAVLQQALVDVGEQLNA
ncbi:MAG: LysR family transcriptional regulator [Rikenellaceae bacterium]